jgi:hypothetical protein
VRGSGRPRLGPPSGGSSAPSRDPSPVPRCRRPAAASSRGSPRSPASAGTFGGPGPTASLRHRLVCRGTIDSWRPNPRMDVFGGVAGGLGRFVWPGTRTTSSFGVSRVPTVAGGCGRGRGGEESGRVRGCAAWAKG